MKKIKLLIASMIGAIALVFAAVLGTKVNAADSGNYYSYKNSETRALVYNDSTAGKSNIALSGSTSSGNGERALTITESIIPNGAAVASGNYFIKVSKNTDISFTTTDSFIFKMNTFINSSNGSVTFKNSSNETLDTKSVSGGKANVILGTDDALAPGTYTFSGTAELNIYEIYINIQAQEGDGYTISYDYNGHGTNSSSLNQTALPETLPSPSVTGYTFGGWYTDSELTTPAVAGAAISANTTLYAKWTVNSSEWCTITFDSNGGSSVASTSQIYGSTYTLPNCTKSGYYLTGWSDGSGTYTSTYTVPSKATQTLTAQWAECIVFDESCYFSKADSNNTAAASNAMFTASGKVNTNADAVVTFNGQTYSTPLKMESSTSLSFILDKDATIYIAFTSSTGNCNIKEENDEKATKLTATNGLATKELTAGSYTIKKADTNNIGFVGLIYVPTSTKIADDVTLAFGHQFDAATEAESTKLRFIGKIDGIAYDSTADISSVVFSFIFNDNARTANCYKLYKGITSLDDTATKSDTTLYVVYSLNNINKAAYSGEALTNIKLTVTFSDGSTKEVSHDSITLPNFE